MEKHGLERYSYSLGLTLPFLASDTPVLALDVLCRFFGVGDGVQVYCTLRYFGKAFGRKKEERSPSQYVRTNVRRLMVS